MNKLAHRVSFKGIYKLHDHVQWVVSLVEKLQKDLKSDYSEQINA